MAEQSARVQPYCFQAFLPPEIHKYRNTIYKNEKKRKNAIKQIWERTNIQKFLPRSFRGEFLAPADIDC